VNELSTYEEDVTTFAEMRSKNTFPDDDLIARFTADGNCLQCTTARAAKRSA
jgi:hypothetical protein